MTRRIRLRLDPLAPDERRLLDQYDALEAGAGRSGQEFFRRCLIVGYSLLVEPNPTAPEVVDGAHADEQHDGARS